MSHFIVFTKEQLLLEMKNIKFITLNLDLIRLLHLLYGDNIPTLNNLYDITIDHTAISYLIDNRLLPTDKLINDIPTIYNFNNSTLLRHAYFNKLNNIKNIDLLVCLIDKYFVDVWPFINNNYDLHYKLLTNYSINICWLCLINGIIYESVCKKKLLLQLFYNYSCDMNVLEYMFNYSKKTDYINNLLKSNYFDITSIETPVWIKYLPVGREVEIFTLIYNHKKFKLKNLDELYKTYGPLFDLWFDRIDDKICKFVTSRRFSYHQMVKLFSEDFLVKLLDKNINLFSDLMSILIKRKIIDSRIINNLDLIYLMFNGYIISNNTKLYNLFNLIINSNITLMDVNDLRSKLTNYIVSNKFSQSLIMSDDEILDDDIVEINTNSDKILELAHNLLGLIEKDCKIIHIPDCGICYSNKVNCVISPCGHSVCILCSIKIDACHICRKEIRDIIRFYL